MKRAKRILITLVLLVILVNYKNKIIGKEYDESILISRKQEIEQLINGGKVTDLELLERLKGYSNNLETWILNTHTTENGKAKIEESEMQTIISDIAIAKGSNSNNVDEYNKSGNNPQINISNTDNNSGNNTTINSEFEKSYYIPKTLQKVPGNIYKAHASTKNKHPEKGDQTGIEVVTGPINSTKRKYLLYRYTGPDHKIPITAALIAGDLTNNENIGYNQIPGREELKKELRRTGYNLDNVGLCRTDCSSFINIVLETAYQKSGNMQGIPLIGENSFGTGGMEDGLIKYNYTKVSNVRKTEKEYRDAGELQMGDILLDPKTNNHTGHTTICIGEYYTSGKIAPESTGNMTNSGGYTAEGEEIDDRQNIDEKKFRFSGLPGDVTYEGEINPIRNFFKKIGDFIDYLLGLLFMIIKVIIIGFTNIIYNIFLTITSFMKK